MIEHEAQRETDLFAQQIRAQSKVINSQTFMASVGLVLSSIFEFLKWCAPAALAFFCTYEMAHFSDTGNKEAAAAFEKILYVMITGAALGWAVSRRKDQDG